MCSPEVWEHSQAHALKCLSPPLPHEENALVQEPPLQQDWTHKRLIFIVLALVGKDIVFRFIIEYSNLRDFYRPAGNNNNRSIFIWGFLKDDILACVENLRLVIQL
jgi:hypothetical protein